MSNVIKSNRYVSIEEIRTLEAFLVHPPKPPKQTESEDAENERRLRSEAEAAAEQILQDAKAAADDHIQQAVEHAKKLQADAAQEIERWWEERRADDARMQEEGRQAGFDAGYREGMAQAEEEIRQRYESMLQQASRMVEEAHRAKEQIIAESEPFLVELATAIARKIIGEQLAVDPEWTVQHVRRTLAKRRDKGQITLCVAPSQFAKIQDAREELTLSIDSQAELQIVPDATVDEGGCVLRTAFGSVDARLDTQLSEVKAALLDVASRSAEGAEGL